MEDYIKGNKAAWEEAFDHRKPGFGEDNAKKLLNEELPFFNMDVKRELQKLHLNGKSIAQFCCNNGRELMSPAKYFDARGAGFDIAENILNQARHNANRAGMKHVEFIASNILEIDPQYDKAFDFIFFTIGAITWFQSLDQLFSVVSRCLKANGMLMIHDFHPMMNMLPLEEGEKYTNDVLDFMAASYFMNTPWLENGGMGYMSEAYKSKTFVSYSHTMAAVVNALADNGISITRLLEFDYDVGLTNQYDGKGFPLSMLLFAKKATV